MRLATVDHGDLDVTVTTLDTCAEVLGQPVGGALATDDGDQLATAAEESADDVDGDLGEVVPDDDDVTTDSTEDVAGLARTRAGERLLAREGDGPVAAEAFSSNTANAARPCTAVRERTRWTSSPSCSAALAAARAAISVSRSLGSTITDRACEARMASSSWPAEARCPGPLVTTTAPAPSNTSASPGPAAQATTATPVAGWRWATCSAKWVTRTR